MKASRIVLRQSLKKQLAELKAQMRASRPFMEAQRHLQQAFLEGYQHRKNEEAREAEAKVASTDKAEHTPSPEPLGGSKLPDQANSVANPFADPS